VQPTVHRFQEFFIGPDADALYGAMLGAVALVLLIACANLANLLLARAIGRSREMSVRMALGGSRARIVRQALIESLALSLMGGALGWWVAKVGVRLYVLSAGAPAWFEHVLDYSMDARVFVYLAMISVATGLLFGLLPAIRLSRLDLQGALKEGGRSATGGGRGKRLSSTLVMGETALAVMLLAGAGVMIRSFLNIYNADAGVRSENIVTALLRLPDDAYPDAAARVSFLERLEARLEAVPGVEAVAIADTLPTWGARSFGYELEGSESTDDQRRPRVAALLVSPDYFATLGAGILAGRGFEAPDGVSGPAVALVNQRFAGLHWPGEDPVGKRLRLYDGPAPGGWRTIIGVAPNIVQNDETRQRFDPVVYLPFRPEPARAMWVMAKAGSAAGLGTAFEREVHALDAELPIWLGPFSLTERLASNYRSARVSGGLFLAFAAIALFLAAVGLYAVIAYAVDRQTREIGVRLAIGASASDVLKMVFALGMRPVAVGLIAGLAGSVAVNRVLQAQLVEVSPWDPEALAAAAAALVAAAALGCWIPARRAMRVDPVTALRQE
jgi:putative ABC transport system permease protein